MDLLTFGLLFAAIFSISYYSFIYSRKEYLSKSGKINRIILCGLISAGITAIGMSNFVKQIIAEENPKEVIVQKKQEIAEQSSPVAYIKLDVPLIDQMEEPQLYNGCEVTSLAMIMNYYGLRVTKEKLAEKIKKVPYQNEEGLYGDPNEGFVGDIIGETTGYGVYVEPIIELAEQFLSDQFQIINLTKKSFDEVLEQLALGTPIWCITTVPMTATDDLEIWQTVNGEIEISWNIHSVVLTGFNQKQVFINDPYGEKTAVSIADFRGAWEQMGSQAMTIQMKKG